jgi:ArsR family transcriptional regulator
MYIPRSQGGKLEPGQFERIAKALSDPQRFALLEAIGANSDCPYRSLCADFPVSKATISHHIKELVQSGLVDYEKEGQFVHCRVRPEVLQAYAAELVRRVHGMSAGEVPKRSKEDEVGMRSDEMA